MAAPLNSRPLTGKVALVTGASRGIGAAAAVRLAQAGAAVAINYHQNKEAAEKIADQIAESGGRSAIIRADVTDKNQVEQMVAAAQRELGTIDVLVNNAYFPFDVGALHELSWESFHRAIEHVTTTAVLFASVR